MIMDDPTKVRNFTRMVIAVHQAKVHFSLGVCGRCGESWGLHYLSSHHSTFALIPSLRQKLLLFCLLIILKSCCPLYRSKRNSARTNRRLSICWSIFAGASSLEHHPLADGSLGNWAGPKLIDRAHILERSGSGGSLQSGVNTGGQLQADMSG